MRGLLFFGQKKLNKKNGKNWVVLNKDVSIQRGKLEFQRDAQKWSFLLCNLTIEKNDLGRYNLSA